MEKLAIRRYIWASSRDYGTYDIGDQRRPEPLLSAHMKYGNRRKVRQNIKHLAPLDVWACTFEECLRKMKKLMTWLIYLPGILSSFHLMHLKKKICFQVCASHPFDTCHQMSGEEQAHGLNGTGIQYLSHTVQALPMELSSWINGRLMKSIHF